MKQHENMVTLLNFKHILNIHCSKKNTLPFSFSISQAKDEIHHISLTHSNKTRVTRKKFQKIKQ